MLAPRLSHFKETEDLKISLITAVLNRADAIQMAVGSVQRQSWKNWEHLVIDGASTDGTLQIVKNTLDHRGVLVSEPDNGIYDALNKGLQRASGDVVGLMHSDDFYADDAVLSDVAEAFLEPTVDAVFGDLEYVSNDNPCRVVRRWKAGEFSIPALYRGWMPPHPTLFLRREVIERWGGFDTSFRIAADYDAVLRYFGKGRIQAAYIPRVLVKMRTGGVSNRSLENIILKMREDCRALQNNGVGGFPTLAMKNLRKLGQFL